MPNFEGNRGTKTILGNREHRKQFFDFWGTGRASLFIISIISYFGFEARILVQIVHQFLFIAELLLFS